MSTKDDPNVFQLRKQTIGLGGRRFKSALLGHYSAMTGFWEALTVTAQTTDHPELYLIKGKFLYYIDASYEFRGEEVAFEP